MTLQGEGQGSGQLGEEDDIARTGRKTAGGISLALTPISTVAVTVSGALMVTFYACLWAAWV